MWGEESGTGMAARRAGGDKHGKDRSPHSRCVGSCASAFLVQPGQWLPGNGLSGKRHWPPWSITPVAPLSLPPERKLQGFLFFSWHLLLLECWPNITFLQTYIWQPAPCDCLEQSPGDAGVCGIWFHGHNFKAGKERRGKRRGVYGWWGGLASQGQELRAAGLLTSRKANRQLKMCSLLLERSRTYLVWKF